MPRIAAMASSALPSWMKPMIALTITTANVVKLHEEAQDRAALGRLRQSVSPIPLDALGDLLSSEALGGCLERRKRLFRCGGVV